MKAILHFIKSEDGPTAVEYAVMLAMILLTCFSAIASFGGAVGDSFSNSATDVSSAMNGGSP